MIFTLDFVNFTLGVFLYLISEVVFAVFYITRYRDNLKSFLIEGSFDERVKLIEEK